MITFSQAMISERLSAITRLLDSSTKGAGAILLYSGNRPPAFANTDASNLLLARIVMKKPSLGEIKGSILTFAQVDSALALASGKAKWARMVNADGLIIADMDVGIDGADAEIIIRKEDGSAAESTQMYAGGEFSLLLAQLIEE